MSLFPTRLKVMVRRLALASDIRTGPHFINKDGEQHILSLIRPTAFTAGGRGILRECGMAALVNYIAVHLHFGPH